MKCKFCGKSITTDHYFITKSGSVCLECKENIKLSLKGIVKNGGSKHEDSSCDSVRDNSNSDIHGRKKEVS